MYWSVGPDGGPVGDVYENLVFLLAEGGIRQIDTTRREDGTVTTRIRVITIDGDVVSDEVKTEMARRTNWGHMLEASHHLPATSPVEEQ